MNRSVIVSKLAELYPKLTRKEVDLLVKHILNFMTSRLIEGERIEIRGFGAFCLKERNSGAVRNPRLGISMISASRHVVYFRPGKELKERVNNLKPSNQITNDISYIKS